MYLSILAQVKNMVRVTQSQIVLDLIFSMQETRKDFVNRPDFGNRIWMIKKNCSTIK